MSCPGYNSISETIAHTGEYADENKQVMHTNTLFSVCSSSNGGNKDIPVNRSELQTSVPCLPLPLSISFVDSRQRFLVTPSSACHPGVGGGDMLLKVD